MKNTIKKLLMPSARRGRSASPLQSVTAEETRRRRALTDAEMERRMERIDEDFRHAFSIIKEHPDTVSIFGSKHLEPGNKYYEKARKLAQKTVEELNLSVVSGGGPGIMEAANRGAKEAKGDSVGMAIELPHEKPNHYTTHSEDFYYFFSRKVALTFTARAYVFFPGGYGTLDELFEILTLKENKRIPQLPVIMVGRDYWLPLHNFIEETLCKKARVLPKPLTKIYTIEDDPDKIIKIIGQGS